MIDTLTIINVLAEWFTDQYESNLINAVRWLIYNRDDIDKDVCKQWLKEHNAEVCRPTNYYVDEKVKTTFEDKTFVEVIGKVK